MGILTGSPRWYWVPQPFPTRILMWVLVLLSYPGLSALGQTQSPRVVVFTKMQSSEFVMRKSGFFSGQKQVIPLVDYDFGTALTEEVTSALSADKRATWRVATAQEQPLLVPVLAGKEVGPLPDSVVGDRVLGIFVWEFGGWSMPGHGRKFRLQAVVYYYDRNSGRELWHKGYYEQIDMPSSLEKAQEDSQTGVKEGLNKLIEKFAEKVRKRVAESSV